MKKFKRKKFSLFITVMLIVILCLSGNTITCFALDEPIAIFNVSKNLVLINESFEVNAILSTPDTINVYEWDWNYDSTFSPSGDTGKIQTHSYSVIGDYQIALKVTDGGSTSIAIKTISVVDEISTNVPQAPIPVPGGPYNINWGEALPLNGTGSFDRNSLYGDRIVYYSWSVGSYNASGHYSGESASTVTLPWDNLGSILSGSGITLYPMLYYPIWLKVKDTTDRSNENVTTLYISIWPTNSSITLSNILPTTLTLTWTESADDVVVNGYKIYKDGSLIDTVAGDVTTYSVTGLTSNTEYTFKVEASNLFNKWSADGPSVTVTTAMETMSIAAYAPITLIQTGDIAHNNVQYVNSAAVIAALPTTINVSLENASVVSVPIEWEDTDGYDITTAASYTFTGTWGDLPDGIDNEDNIGAPIVEVVVQAGTNTTTSGRDSRGSSSQYDIQVTDNTTIITATPDLISDSGFACASITTETLNHALNEIIPDSHGIRTVQINIPAVEGAQGYESTLPASFLTSGSVDKNITINTEIASILLPSNMLSSENIDAEHVSVTIALGDKTSLPADVQEQIGDRPIIELELSVDGKHTIWQNEGAPVTVTMPYEPTEEELQNMEHITVWYMDGEGNAVPITSGQFNPETGMVTFTTTHFSKYAVVYVNKIFLDLDNTGWAKKQIQIMASKGIINGTSIDNFSPTANISRADYLTLLMRTLGLKGYIDNNFDDVSVLDYFYNEVGIAKNLGITSGQGNNIFSPKKSITRQDMIVLTKKALEIKGKLTVQGEMPDLEGFSDKAWIASYALDSISSLVKAGLIEGSGEKINPLGSTTRAEAAVLIYRIYHMQ